MKTVAAHWIPPVVAEYHVNLNERGFFYADVRVDDETVFEIRGFEMFEDGFMRHAEDLDGLASYLIGLGVLPVRSGLIAA